MVAPAPLLEPTVPDWATRFALRISQSFLGLFPGAPVRLWRVAFADLPDATRWPGSVVYVSDKAKVGLSNGVAWTDAAGGAL